MTDQILEKLNIHISNGINKEADVIYLLVQIRKILEREKLKDEYSTLDLYCDWVLHPDIKNTNKSGQILDKIERAVFLLDTHNSNKEEIASSINEAISFVNFHKNLKNFFIRNKLTFFTDKNYTILLTLLIEILKDIPLLSKHKKFNFSFTSGKEVNSFNVRIELSDKRVYRSPMTPIATNWAAGVAVPSGAYEPDDSDSNSSTT